MLAKNLVDRIKNVESNPKQAFEYKAKRVFKGDFVFSVDTHKDVLDIPVLEFNIKKIGFFADPALSVLIKGDNLVNYFWFHRKNIMSLNPQQKIDVTLYEDDNKIYEFGDSCVGGMFEDGVLLWAGYAAEMSGIQSQTANEMTEAFRENNARKHYLEYAMNKQMEEKLADLKAFDESKLKVMAADKMVSIQRSSMDLLPKFTLPFTITPPPSVTLSQTQLTPIVPTKNTYVKLNTDFDI